MAIKKSISSELVSRWIKETGIVRQRESWHCGDMWWEINTKRNLFVYKRQVDGLDKHNNYQLIREEFYNLFGDYVVKEVGYRYEGDGESFYVFHIAPPLEQLAQNEMTFFTHSFME